MASAARLFSSLSQIRTVAGSGLKQQKIFVRGSRRLWRKHLLTFGIPFAGYLTYSLWYRRGQILTIERPGESAKQNAYSAGGEEDATTSWKVFIRCTRPFKVLRKEWEVTADELAQMQSIKDIFKDEGKRDNIYQDLLTRVNTRLARMKFLGAGVPNVVEVISVEAPVYVRYYRYMADGLEISPTHVRWVTNEVASRVATKLDSILATPNMVYSSLVEVLLSQWDSPRSQVIPGTPQESSRRLYGTGSQRPRSTSPSDYPPDTSGRLKASPAVAPIETKVLPSQAGSVNPDSRSKPKPFFSYDNQVDVINSFLSQQKEVVRRSNGVPVSSAHRLFDNFWREYQHERSLRTFSKHDPPGGNIILSVAVIIKGPKRRILLFVEGDYDVTTETWGPIFIEPMESLRSKARRRNDP